MTDGQYLLQAILDNPDDDAVRLVYADWLQENGEDAAGCIVRTQVGREPDHTSVINWTKASGWRIDRGPSDAGRFMPGSWADWVSRSLPVAAGVTYVCRRGFVAEVRAPLDDLLRHGASVLLAHPVTRMVVTDKSPRRRHGEDLDAPWCWHVAEVTDAAKGRVQFLPPTFSGIGGRIYGELCGRCRHFVTEDDALEGLYAATLAECQDRAAQLRNCAADPTI